VTASRLREPQTIGVVDPVLLETEEESVAYLTLDELVSETGPMPWDAGLECVQKIAEILADADDDLVDRLSIANPSAVLIDDDGNVRVCLAADELQNNDGRSHDLSALLQFATGRQPAPTPEYATIGRLIEERFCRRTLPAEYRLLIERISVVQGSEVHPAGCSNAETEPSAEKIDAASADVPNRSMPIGAIALAFAALAGLASVAVWQAL